MLIAPAETVAFVQTVRFWPVAQLVVTIALAIAFLVMGTLHFVPGFARGMGAMIPQRMRGPFSARVLVRFTGVCEIAGAIGLLIPQLHLAAVIALSVFLVVVFPANAFASRHPERFGKAATPFVPRLIAQIALILLLVFTALQF